MAHDERAGVRLFLCGLGILFWELILIRWLGSCVRIVAYYTNFVLLAAFLGIGSGSILARYRFRFDRALLPLLSLCVFAGIFLGEYLSMNPRNTSEFIWLGKPLGLGHVEKIPSLTVLPFWVPLIAVYALTTATFASFGQMLGRLFQRLAPLRGYSIEITGSIAGIFLFGVVSYFQLSPLAWMGLGFLILAPLVERRAVDVGVAILCAAGVLAGTWSFATQFTWSPYYKIQLAPFSTIFDMQERRPVRFDRPLGVEVTVNNDFHQMMLDLRPRAGEHPFITSWRAQYDAPYSSDALLPAGPILIVGSGTGNDVAAALRETRRRIYAVEIDPAILEIGRRDHPEHPYADPRVTVVQADARSFVENTDIRFARVVFGFLDSHTLLSSFSSLRLDNFVYTRESFEQVRRILVPGGEVTVTFASNTPWLHERLIALLTETFGSKVDVVSASGVGYANGTLYRARKIEGSAPSRAGARVPTDRWPFLYLASPGIPLHYWPFLGLVIVTGCLPFALLPRGERRIRVPFFLLGAGFFLLETSNVVSLSLLYGSTWIVNMVVFGGILILVLAGNLLSQRLGRTGLLPVVIGLGLSLVAAYATPTSALLRVENPWLQGSVAILVFLGPVLFAAILFARLIQNEPAFYQAYGSNLLGAVVGGAAEYSSLFLGFKSLFLLAIVFYAGAVLCLGRGLRRGP